MKGTSFNKPLEWNIETQGESWNQGALVSGTLTVKNHGIEDIDLSDAGVGLAFADIKKVHSRTEGALKVEVKDSFKEAVVKGGELKQLSFSLTLPENCAITDKKGSYFLSYGRGHLENHLQLKVEPKALFAKIVGLLDTFHRFKLKEIKTAKNGVEYKLIPPASRDMANLEALSLVFSMDGESLKLDYEFQVKKLDTTGVTNKIQKTTSKITRVLTPKEYSLGRDLINQDGLLKSIDSVLNEVRLTNVF